MKTMLTTLLLITSSAHAGFDTLKVDIAACDKTASALTAANAEIARLKALPAPVCPVCPVVPPVVVPPVVVPPGTSSSTIPLSYDDARFTSNKLVPGALIANPVAAVSLKKKKK